MSDCKTVVLEASIPEETLENLKLYVKRTNGNLHNEVSRLLNQSIRENYKKFPNLLEKQTKPEA